MKNRVNINLSIATTKHRKELRRRHKRRQWCEYYIPSTLTNEQFRKSQKERVPIYAPNIFSISKNHDETIAVLNKMLRLIISDKFALLDLSRATMVDLETICLLSALMMLPSNKLIYLAVKIPKKTFNSVGNMFHAAQFEEMIMRRKEHNFTHGSFLSMTDTRLNKKPIQKELDRTLKFFGRHNFEKLKNLSSILVEIVDNTANHANPRKRNSTPWILNTMELTGKDGKKRKLYCVVDLGVGIYNSLIDKTAQYVDSRKPGIKRWMADIKKCTQNTFFSRNIPLGIESTTGDSGRGKGMKYIYEQAAKNIIYTRFEIITNKAILNLLDLQTVKQDEKEDFSGTIYIWEVTI